MEEGMLSTASDREVARNIAEVCASSLVANDSLDGASKRVSKKFKGVVEQPNGHWGTQIYANHERVWLGTFSSEIEAAMAYDSAAIKLRGEDCHRNFPWTKATSEEPHFQNQYTTEVVLSMIKDGSYRAEFCKFLRSRSATESMGTDIPSGSLARVQNNGNRKMLKRFLFQKELTPSDVGKLNRLVIPVNYARKHFPSISEAIRQKVLSGTSQLVFYDGMMRSWTFRFCYWNSSKSFVFTKGWSRFVKSHHLKANDTITFLQCQKKQLGDSNNNDPHSFYMIKVNWDGAQDDDVSCLDENNVDYQYDDIGNGGMSLAYDLKLEAVSENTNEDEEEDAQVQTMAERKSFIRIFGVEMGVA